MSKKRTKPPWGDDPDSFVMEKIPVSVEEICIRHGDYILLKSIIKTKLFLPEIPKIILYDFHITAIKTWEFFKEHINNSSYEVMDSSSYDGNIEKELELFCPDLDEQKLYYFNRVRSENGTELPLFYGMLFENKGLGIQKHNLDNISKWKDGIIDALTKYLHVEKFQPSYLANWFIFCNGVGEAMLGFIQMSKNKELLSNNIHINDGEEKYPMDVCEKILNYKTTYSWIKVQESIDLPLKNYLSAVMDSFTKLYLDEKIILCCPNCENFFLYKQSKIYCCGTCSKSAANKRNYKSHKPPTE